MSKARARSTGGGLRWPNGCSATCRASAGRPGGFYVWLDVGDGAAFAKELWRRSGVKVMPGAYMAKETIPGDPTSNPGHSYVRIALVHDSLTITAALERVADLMQRGGVR